jgi:hypothetical protein
VPLLKQKLKDKEEELEKLKAILKVKEAQSRESRNVIIVLIIIGWKAKTRNLNCKGPTPKDGIG